MTARYLVGDTRDVLRTLPAGSVDLVLTSPPFLALRNYLPADHPSKDREIGGETSPGEFLDVLLDVVDECARVLAPHGSLVFELGDTYSGSGGGGGDYKPANRRDGQPVFAGSADAQRREWTKYYRGSDPPRRRTRTHNFYNAEKRYSENWNAGRTDAAKLGFSLGDLPATGGPGWPTEKCLCLVPQSFAWALAYGHNPFTGRTIEPWRIRNIVAWCRPNPPVGALADKFRPATSYLTVACKARDRYFDLHAVRTPNVNPRPQETNEQKNAAREAGQGHGFDERTVNPAGTPPNDWWAIPTSPYPGAHFATWPEKLCVVPILSMTPEKVCTTCGLPARRIVESTRVDDNGDQVTGDWNAKNYEPGVGYTGQQGAHARGGDAAGTIYESVGWTDCGHNTWRRGVVLDPFAGSGTTLAVAEGHGRDSVGIDLDDRNRILAYDRVGGLFLEETSW
jgi:DNA modification methylase